PWTCSSSTRSSAARCTATPSRRPSTFSPTRCSRSKRARSIRALYRLELDGAISGRWGASENNRKAKFYALTRRGRKIIASQQETWSRLSAAVQRVLAR
ncbi:MAG: hypothetical protein ACRD96_00340, partial [Bryobacteraceae bacterium]